MIPWAVIPPPESSEPRKLRSAGTRYASSHEAVTGLPPPLPPPLTDARARAGEERWAARAGPGGACFTAPTALLLPKLRGPVELGLSAGLLLLLLRLLLLPATTGVAPTAAAAKALVGCNNTSWRRWRLPLPPPRVVPLLLAPALAALGVAALAALISAAAAPSAPAMTGAGEPPRSPARLPRAARASSWGGGLRASTSGS